MRKVTRDVQAELAYQRATPQLVLVMGMHRSGTSCITRVINLMGASLGPVDDQWVPGSDELHWESSEAIWINDQILARTGGSWQVPPSSIRAMPRDYVRCRQLLWQFAGTKTAVFKDPRMMLTYPVWRRVLPRHRFVVCVRHPMGVGRSLARRDSMTLDQGLRLWATYNERFLAALSDAADVHWIDFDEGGAGVRRLVHQLAGVWGLQETPEALSHYNAEAHHHRDVADLPADIARLYETLIARVRASSTALDGPAAPMRP